MEICSRTHVWLIFMRKSHGHSCRAINRSSCFLGFERSSKLVLQLPTATEVYAKHSDLTHGNENKNVLYMYVRNAIPMD